MFFPAEEGRWWRRPIEGEVPHLALLSKRSMRRYRGPIWSEDRFTSGKPVTGKVLISTTGDFLVEVRPRSGKGNMKNLHKTWDGNVSFLSVEVMAEHLGVVMGALEERMRERREIEVVAGDIDEENMGSLLSPHRRADLCR